MWRSYPASRSGEAATVGGVTYPNFAATYRWLCWEYEAMRWRTSWCEAAREIPSTP